MNFSYFGLFTPQPILSWMKPLGKPLAGIKLKMPKMPTAVSAAATPASSVGAPPPVKPMNAGQVGVRTPKSKSMPDATDKPSVFYKGEQDAGTPTSKSSSVQKLKDFLSKSSKNKQLPQSSADTRSPDMSKKYTPQEAAMAVLKKAHEMLNQSPLAKGEWTKIHNKLEKEGYSKKSADKIDGAIKAKMNKNEDCGNAMVKAEVGAMVKPAAPKEMAGEVKQLQAETENLSTPGHLPQNQEKYASELRGHLKLAKFLGAMEQKRKSKPANTDLNPHAPKEGKDFGVSDPKATGKSPKADT